MLTAAQQERIADMVPLEGDIRSAAQSFRAAGLLEFGSPPPSLEDVEASLRALQPSELPPPGESP